MYKAFKFRLYPTEEQKEKVLTLSKKEDLKYIADSKFN